MDRKIHIESEFSKYSQFDLQVFKAIEDDIPAFGLYRSLISIVQQAKKLALPYVLICEDDHTFTADFNFEKFKEDLERLEKDEADIFLGGVSWFDYALSFGEGLYWINTFTGAQFQVIYAKMFDLILHTPFHKHDIIDRWIANLTDRVFVTFPMISIQHDFGYSDVTVKNNQTGRVEMLFSDTVQRFYALKEIEFHIKKCNESKELSIEPDYSDLELPTYIINLEQRTDRLAHVKKEFLKKKEFKISIVDACKEENGALGLWYSIRKAVLQAKENKDEIILICEDDHTFCETYNKKTLFDAIYKGAYLGADILLGGVSYIRQGIPVDDNLCWIDRFHCTQFTVIYHHFFETILDAEFLMGDTADEKLSRLTGNKYTIHPFISVQHDFGYSDIPIAGFSTKHYLNKFVECSEKLDYTRRKKLSFCNG